MCVNDVCVINWIMDWMDIELDGKWMDGKWIEWMWKVDLKSGAVPDLTHGCFCISINYIRCWFTFHVNLCFYIFPSAKYILVWRLVMDLRIGLFLTVSRQTWCSSLATETGSTRPTTLWFWLMGTRTTPRRRGMKRWGHVLVASTLSPSVSLLQ